MRGVQAYVEGISGVFTLPCRVSGAAVCICWKREGQQAAEEGLAVGVVPASMTRLFLKSH